MITFPGLGLTLHINRIAFTLFGVEVYWYAIFMVVAIVAGMLVCILRNKKACISFDTILDLALFAIPTSILFARLYYILFNLNYYLANPKAILEIKSGGLAIYGAIIGGALTCFVYCKKKKINLLELFDFIVPALSLGQSIGRWGNFVNQEAYGTPTTSFLRMGLLQNGNIVEVHPTFLYESIATFFLFLLLLQFREKEEGRKFFVRRYKGQLTCVYFMTYSFVRFWIEGIRIDSLMLFGVRISQVLSFILFVAFCCILSYEWLKDKKTEQSSTK